MQVCFEYFWTVARWLENQSTNCESGFQGLIRCSKVFQCVVQLLGCSKWLLGGFLLTQIKRTHPENVWPVLPRHCFWLLKCSEYFCVLVCDCQGDQNSQWFVQTLFHVFKKKKKSCCQGISMQLLEWVLVHLMQFLSSCLVVAFQ